MVLITFLREFVCFVLPYLLFGGVARCQSTSSHGARRRLTFVQPTHKPAN